ncbi:MAG: signal peptidase II [Bacteroidia bacterium]
MTYRTKIIVFFSSCLAMIGLDQVTKELARIYLRDKGSFSYFNDMFRWEYVENTGAFLSLGSTLPDWANIVLLSVLPSIVLLLVAYYVVKNMQHLPLGQMLCFSGIIAGGVGNLIDRIFNDRHVTDFMNMGIGSLRTGIFNVADVYIMFGMIIMLLFFRDTKIFTTEEAKIESEQANP